MTRLPLVSRALAERAAPFVEAGVLRPEDLLAVDVLAERHGSVAPEVLLAWALALAAPRNGHVGLWLDAPGRCFPARGEDPAALPWPEPAAWLAALSGSGLVERGAPDPADRAPRPLVLQAGGGRHLLATRRMAEEQVRLAAALRAVAAGDPEPAVPPGVEAEAARWIPWRDGSEPPQAVRALRQVARGRLALVVGGPGTGKTWSLLRVLAMLLLADPELRVELAAPTGKAAVRMHEAIAEGLADLPVPEPVRDRLAALRPGTLHGLLGLRPGAGPRGREPVSADVVVVDEVSMVDLELMRFLAERVGEGARLVLLGDPDQLASVSAGTVLADLRAAARADAGGPLGAALVTFSVNHRFRDAPTIARLADCIREGGAGRIAEALDLLAGRATPPGGEPVAWHGPGELGVAGLTEAELDVLAAPLLAPGGLGDRLVAALRRGGNPLDEAAGLLSALEGYRVLTTLRRGPRGAEALAARLAGRLRAHLAAQAGFRAWEGGGWSGRAVMVLRNDHGLGLANGDVGLVLPDGEGRPLAVFPGVMGAPRRVPWGRLPPWTDALAMTVHKSQGSQFDRVALVLAGRPTPIQTRELVYTALTRARRRLAWYGGEAEMAEALRTRVERASGLADLLLPAAG